MVEASVNQLWRFFCSLRLTVLVLLLLFFGCVLGMFFDQTLNFHEQFSPYEHRPWLRAILVFFEIGDVFHSWWFSVVVLLLALNLIACSLERLPPIWLDIRNPPLLLTENLWLSLLHKKAVHFAQWKEAQEKIANVVPKKVHMMQDGGKTYYFWEKQKWGRLGVYLIHIALLLIMFASIATTNLGVDGFMTIPEGQGEKYVRIRGPGGLAANAELNFSVICRDFRLRTFVDGSPLSYESDLEIWEPKSLHNPVIKKTIKVNDPLQYQGYIFYQASYQPWKGEEKVQLALGPHGQEKLVYNLRLGEKVRMSTGHSFSPVEIYDNYAGLGEAVKIRAEKKGQEDTHFVVFRQYPEFDQLVRRGDFDLAYLGLDQSFATGLSVGKAPGISVVFAAFLLLFIGLLMAFVLRHRRYYLSIEPDGHGGAQLRVAAIALRHERAFAAEFGNLIQSFEEQ